jgi:hypothetical protein
MLMVQDQGALYQRSAFRPVAADGDTLLVRVPGDRPPVALPRSLVEMVTRCRVFASLDEHARRIGQALRMPPGQHAALLPALQEAAAQGLLISAEDLLRKARAAGAQSDRPRLNGLGVVTRNRPGAVVRCLRSFGAHLRAHQRTLPALVVDSSGPEPGERLRRALAGLQAEQGRALRWVGMPQKEAFAGKLAVAAGVDRELVRFALLDPMGLGHDVGSNRNTLLLLQAGQLFLSADDDMVCEPRQPPGPSRPMALAADELPTTLRLHPDLASARDSLAPLEGCVLDLHERVLGRSLGASLDPAADTGVDVQAVEPGMLASLLEGRARTAASFGGYYGDSGASFPAFFLWSDPTVRAQLQGGVESYRALLASRQVVRLAPALTLSSSRFSMCGHVALDARELLPPFFPVMRGEDLSFGQLLRSCFEDAFFAYLPSALAHLPWEPRATEPHRLWDPRPSVGMRTLVAQMLELAESGAALAAPGAPRLRLTGRCLRELATRPPGDFLELLRDRASYALGRLCSKLGQLRAEAGDAPPDWTADLERFLDDRRRVLDHPERAIPLELLPGADAATAARTVQDLIERYGRLLEAWPEIFAAARSLAQNSV